jgi:hypothetical protein
MTLSRRNTLDLGDFMRIPMFTLAEPEHVARLQISVYDGTVHGLSRYLKGF